MNYNYLIRTRSYPNSVILSDSDTKSIPTVLKITRKFFLDFSEIFEKGLSTMLKWYCRYFTGTIAVYHSKDCILSRLCCSVTDRSIDIILFVFGTNGTVN